MGTPAGVTTPAAGGPPFVGSQERSEPTYSLSGNRENASGDVGVVPAMAGTDSSCGGATAGVELRYGRRC
jgi:hypothetical protein